LTLSPPNFFLRIFSMEKDSRVLDLVGTACPMNFVRIKMALEELEPETPLEVRLDGPPVVQDVKRTLLDQGYEVLSMQEEGKTARLVVAKSVNDL